MKNYSPRFLLLVLFLGSLSLFAQTPRALLPGLRVDSLLRTQGTPNRLAMDPLTGDLYYCTYGGNVFVVHVPAIGPAYDSLVYTSAEHGITDPEGLCFVDSAMYLSGSFLPSPGVVVARISKAKLQPNGLRTWSTVVETAPHPNSKHPFTSVIADPQKQYLYWASGARTMAGEVWSDNGRYPGRRETPFNSRLFKIPIQSHGLILPNDSSALDPYTFCWGLRNAYSMVFDHAGKLIAIDNSGERDDPEELNWLQQGQHYGFPWRMGGNWNPLLDPNYDVNQDPLVNHSSGGYLDGIFAADPNFPSPPNLVMVDPIRNLGPDADYYRDSLTGQVQDASATGYVLRSFTGHRSPLGLTMDNDSLLAGDFKGRAFVLSYMPGGDSMGMSPVSPWGTPGPYVDPAQDLLQLDLSFDTGLSEYVMQTRRVIDGLYLPVDAVLDGRTMYIAEQRGGSRFNLWKVTFADTTTAAADGLGYAADLRIVPNPVEDFATLHIEVPQADRLALSMYDIQDRVLQTSADWQVRSGNNALDLDLRGLSTGIYILNISGKHGQTSLRILKH